MLGGVLCGVLSGVLGGVLGCVLGGELGGVSIHLPTQMIHTTLYNLC